MFRSSHSAVLQRQSEAVNLAGQGKSFDEIARHLGYANRSSAWRLVDRALKSQVADAVQEYRAMELARLDALQVSWWEAACSGDSSATQIVLRVIDQRIRLLGLETTSKSIEKSGPKSLLDIAWATR